MGFEFIMEYLSFTMLGLKNQKVVMFLNLN